LITKLNCHRLKALKALKGEEQVMAAQKAWYWLAAGVVALGLNSEYHNGGLQVLHGLADRSDTLVARVNGRAHNYVELAKMLMGREDAQPAPDVEVAMAQLPPEPQIDVETASNADTAVEFADRTEAMSDLINGQVQANLDCAKASLDRAIASNHLERLQPSIEHLQLRLQQASLRMQEARLMRAARVTRGVYACTRMHKIVVKVPQVRVEQGPETSLVVFAGGQ
jgi:hypothetical protein